MQNNTKFEQTKNATEHSVQPVAPVYTNVQQSVQPVAPVYTNMQQPTAPTAPVYTNLSAGRAQSRAGGRRLWLSLAGAAVGVVLVVIGSIFIAATVNYSRGRYGAAGSNYQLLGMTERAEECNYLQAGKYVEMHKFGRAAKLYAELGDYRDAPELHKRALFLHAEQCAIKGEYAEAAQIYAELGGYLDSAARLKEVTYLEAEECYLNEDFATAYEKFQALANVGYGEAAAMARESCIFWGMQLYADGSYGKCSELLAPIAEEEEMAMLYMTLADFQLFKSDENAMYDFKALESYLDLFTAYSSANPDAAKACSDKVFWLARFFNADWVCDSFSIEATAQDGDMTISYELPWSTPSDGKKVVLPSINGLELYIDGQWWFTITGFDDYTADLHPQEVYITGSDNEKYVFALKGTHDEK